MSLDKMNKFNSQSPEVRNAVISKSEFQTRVIDCFVVNGSKYRPGFWKKDIYEVETSDGVFITKDNLSLHIGKQIIVTSNKNTRDNVIEDIGWIWLNLISASHASLKNSFFEIQDALSANIKHETCYVYKLEIGGDTYIGFTSQDPEERVNAHIKNSKDGGSQKINRALRKWGYLYEIEILGKYDNEILGLLAEIKFIDKLNPTLNESIGGEGKNFNIVVNKNDLDEDIFVVHDKHNAL